MGFVDKVKNLAQDAEGKVKETMGKATGDESREAEGVMDQRKSDFKKAGENVKDAAKGK